MTGFRPAVTRLADARVTGVRVMDPSIHLIEMGRAPAEALIGSMRWRASSFGATVELRPGRQVRWLLILPEG
jgi:hypothetical protein